MARGKKRGKKSRPPRLRRLFAKPDTNFVWVAGDAASLALAREEKERALLALSMSDCFVLVCMEHSPDDPSGSDAVFYGGNSGVDITDALCVAGVAFEQAGRIYEALIARVERDPAFLAEVLRIGGLKPPA